MAAIRARPATRGSFRDRFTAACSSSTALRAARRWRRAFAIRSPSDASADTITAFAAELALDGSGASGGREKLVPIRQGDDWGFPCCATANLPYAAVGGNPNCASVPPESASFVIGHTPFGFDFESGIWPAPYANTVLLAFHGFVGSWSGARVAAVPTTSDGMPAGTSELGGGAGPIDFATGWDDGLHQHGRPAGVSFARDGRAFISNDVNGDIFWVAPVTLNAPRDAGRDANPPPRPQPRRALPTAGVRSTADRIDWTGGGSGVSRGPLCSPS